MTFRQFFTTNTWWGKLLGAFFGYLMGRAPGAVLGILIGNLFDRGLMMHFGKPHWHFHQEKREPVQQLFFETTFSVMGHIAKACGKISPQDIAMANHMMDEMHLSLPQRDVARTCFQEGKEKSFDLIKAVQHLYQTCYDNPELLKLFLDIQYKAAMTNGFSITKLDRLDIIFKEFGFAPLHQQYRFYEDFNPYASNEEPFFEQKTQGYSSHRHQSAAHHGDALAQAYAILEVTSSMSKQDIKRAYRRLISRNHPDKLIAQGLPDAMIKLANDKTQKITKAYEQICLSKGW